MQKLSKSPELSNLENSTPNAKDSHTNSTPNTKSFTKLKSPSSAKKDVLLTPTQIIEEDDDSKESAKPDSPNHSSNYVAKESLSAAYGRHLVEQVERDHISIRLHLKDLIHSGFKRICQLKGSWTDTLVKENDIVNILSVEVSENCDEVVIDDMNGLLVVNPDMLVSGTSIVSTLFCMRKAVLNERFKGQDGPSRSMLIGTLVHELLQVRKIMNLYFPILNFMKYCLDFLGELKTEPQKYQAGVLPIGRMLKRRPNSQRLNQFEIDQR